MKYQDNEIEIIRREYPDGGVQAVQKFLNRSTDSIRHQAKKHLITRTENFRESRVDISRFVDKFTSESSYILGLIWGDGHAAWNPLSRQYVTSLTLKESDFKDIQHLLKDFKVHLVKKRKSTWEQCIMSYLNSKPLATFLQSQDYCQKSIRSPVKIIQRIPKALRHYFWRGYFDADGSNNGLPEGKYKIVIAGSLKQDWTDLKNLCLNLGVDYKISRIIRKNGTSSSLVVCGYNNVLRFMKFLYEGETIGLYRKQKNYLTIRKPIREKSLDK
jgi:hypothetical protein